jgi:hypothetical protein
MPLVLLLKCGYPLCVNWSQHREGLASCTMGTGSFLGVKSGRGVTLTAHPLRVPLSRKGRAIPPPHGPCDLYRATLPVQGCTLPPLSLIPWRFALWSCSWLHFNSILYVVFTYDYDVFLCQNLRALLLLLSTYCYQTRRCRVVFFLWSTHYFTLWKLS